MLFAYAGGPSTFPQQREDLTHLATADAVIFSDGDLETWELASVDFALPLGTDFVGIEVIAGENIFNNVSTGPEYDGHFADDVQRVRDDRLRHGRGPSLHERQWVRNREPARLCRLDPLHRGRCG